MESKQLSDEDYKAMLESVLDVVRNLTLTGRGKTVELRLDDTTCSDDEPYRAVINEFRQDTISIHAKLTTQQAAEIFVQDAESFIHEVCAEWVEVHHERIERFLHLLSQESAATITEEVSVLDTTNFNGEELFEDLPLEFCSYEGQAKPTDPRTCHQLQPCAPFVYDDPPELLRLKRIRIVMFLAIACAQNAPNVALLICGMANSWAVTISIEAAGAKRGRKLQQHVLVIYGVGLVKSLIRSLTHVKKRLYDPEDKSKWTDVEGYRLKLPVEDWSMD
ncbi:hypothetical protein B0T19DRAFT_445493 [Cercophora scortea]|uniref:Uncharacterized protein n=1 Tax=Cercophora scortea TaxID=314031 RepID=A0AAE0I755_9PEZI|nr:hypothetical protein B0T19DRAFT_445493 [Cercophora scortea]